MQADVERFECLWANLDPNVRVFDLPEAAREKILQLRTEERPYSEPEWVRMRRLREAATTYQLSYPTLPSNLYLRDYQEEAIASWFKHDCKGLFGDGNWIGKNHHGINSISSSL